MSLGKKTVGGALWAVAATSLARLIGVLSTLILTHYLTPEVAGEVGVASVVVLSASQLSSLGLGQFISAKPDAGRALVFCATATHVTLGAAAVGIVLLLTEPLAPLVNAPELGRYVPGLVLAMFLDRLGYIPERVLIRDLRFRPVALSRMASEFAYAGVSVGLAAAGWGGQAIVVANIAQSMLKVVAFVSLCDRREWLTPARVTWARLGELLAFGLPTAIGGITSFAARKWDNLLFSGFFGTGTAGLYNLAYNLADIPASNVAEQVGDVLVPSFARMEAKERGQALVRASGMVALIVFPLATGLAAVSQSLVRAVFKPEWQGLAPLLLLLSVLSIFRPVSYIIAAFLFAQGRPRAVMQVELAKTVLLLALVAAFALVGPLWACAGVGVAFAAAALASIWIVHQDGVSAAALSRTVLRPLIACGPMTAAAVGAGRLAQLAGAHPIFEVAASIIAGAVTYVPSALVLAPEPSREALAFVRDLRRPHAGRAEGPRSGMG